MITDQALQEAIAECNGKKNPDANTCMKLAAYYTIRDHLGGSGNAPVLPVRSFALHQKLLSGRATANLHRLSVDDPCRI